VPTSTAAVTLRPVPGPVAYSVQEVMSTDVNDLPVAAHKLTVSYTLFPAEGGAITLTVRRVELEAKRDDYKVKLDSSDAANMIRVRGGADTLVAFESIIPFAMLDLPLSVKVSPSGRYTEIQGGDAIRKAMLAIHPANTGKDPKNRARVEIELSDQRLLEWLLPPAVFFPSDGPLAPGRRVNEERNEALESGEITVARATLLGTAQGAALMSRTKWQEAPAKEPEEPKPGETRTTFIGGEGEATMLLSDPHLGFERAGMKVLRSFDYSGPGIPVPRGPDSQPAEGAPIPDRAPMRIERTRLWARAGAAPSP
jgi:hypothetical protein